MIDAALLDAPVIDIPGASSEFVTLRSGAAAHYMVAGPVDAPAVVLLHGGLPGSSGAAGWRLMMPALAEAGFRVYAPDRPGFGLADPREEHWPVRGHMSWVGYLRDFADAIRLETFALGGNSQGAQSAAYFAVHYPERVEKLLLIASSGWNTALGLDPQKLKPGIPFPRWEGTRESMREVMTTIIHGDAAIPDQVLDIRTADAIRQSGAYAAAAQWNRASAKDPNLAQLVRLKGRLDELTIPAIYLYGRQDVLSPVENAYLQEDVLTNVQFFYPNDCGHQGQTDQPEMFNRVFSEFLRDGIVSASTAEWAGVSERRPILPSVMAS